MALVPDTGEKSQSEVSEVEPVNSLRTAYQSIPLPTEDLKTSVTNEPGDETKGYALVFFAALVYKCMGLLSREVTLYYGISVPNMIFIRGVSLLFFCFLSSCLFVGVQQVFTVPINVIPLLVLRGVVGGTALSLSYKALSLLPLGITNSIFFLSSLTALNRFHHFLTASREDPIFTMLLSNFLIAERVTTTETVAAVVSISGVILVANPTFAASPTMKMHAIGVMCSIASSFGASIAYVTIRAIGKRAHFMLNIISFGTFLTCFGVILGGARLPGLTKGLGLAVLSTVFGFLGQASMTRAIQLCRASTGSLLRTVDVPIAYVLGLIFLNEVPHPVSIVGSFLVLAGAVIVGLNAVHRSTSLSNNR